MSATNQTLPGIDLTTAEETELDALALVAEIQELKTQQATLAEREKFCRDQLAVMLDFGSHKVGDWKISITAPLRYTSEGKTRLMERYPASERPDFYELTLNTKAVDAILKDDAKEFKSASSIVCSIR